MLDRLPANGPRPRRRAGSWFNRSSSAGAQGGLPTLSADLHPRAEAATSPLRTAGGLRLSQGFVHRPVMEAEVVELMSPIPPGLVVDATVGGGGHSAALLRTLPGIRIVGLDRDEQAARAARERLVGFGGRVRVLQARFDRLSSIAAEEAEGAFAGGAEAGDAGLSGVLFDLGVSSPQLDEPARGFSYRHDGPLDMRMDRDESRTAADLINSIDERSLARLLAAHGEERFARRIARAIVAGRPIDTTTRLAEVVSVAIPAAARRRGHPAKRVFQALRVELNEELELLGPAIDDAIELLAPGGRCVVLSYHSGEDRIVKQRFALAASGGCACPPGLPCACGAVPLVRVLTRGARLAGVAEIAANPRAESARLRAVERLEPPPEPPPPPVLRVVEGTDPGPYRRTGRR